MNRPDRPPASAPPVPRPQLSFHGAPSASSAPPPLRLDDATLTAVSRAIVGRLDVVDLVGRNTATEAAERVG